MKTSIALVGFMGTGKTEVGQALASRLGKDFIELDGVIEKLAGKTIPAIFKEDGEIAFRELEIQATKSVAGKENAVIAGGGGIVLNKINIDRLKTEAVVVRLTASPEMILRRTDTDKGGRPLLQADDRAAHIKQLLKFRQPFYQRAADITVNTSRLSIDGVVRSIIARLDEYEGYAK